MPNYTQISAEFELVTPAFIGSAYQEKAGCIDPKAVKAALRYWWRVTHWTDYAQGKSDSDADVAKALAAMHAEEMRLFGGVAQAESKVGQGIVQIFLKNQTLVPKTYNYSSEGAGIRYLIGQGLREAEKSNNLRPALQPGKFTVEIIVRHSHVKEANAPKELDASIQQQIHKAVRAFGLLGGLGGRQNRGFGRVVLLSYKCNGQADDAIPNTLESYKAEIERWFGKESGPLPPIPAQIGGNLHRLVVPKEGKITVPNHKIENNDYKNEFPPKKRKVPTPSAWALLDAIGEQFLLERSWGTDKEIIKQDGKKIEITLDKHYAVNMPNKNRKHGEEKKIRIVAEQNYKFDHDWIKLPVKRHHPPYRMLFGLPYGFGSTPISVEFKEKLTGRRSSPMCIHITLIDGKPIGVLYALKSHFLPESAELKIGDKNLICAKDLQLDWDVVQNFFNRFDPNITARKPVPKTKP